MCPMVGTREGLRVRRRPAPRSGRRQRGAKAIAARCLVVCVLCSAAFGASAHGDNAEAEGPRGETLGQRIQQVLSRAGPEVGPEELEGELLILTARWKAPEERAAIYAAIAEMRTNTYLSSIDPWKVVGYSQKALEHTCDPVERCRLYGYWGGEIFYPIYTPVFALRIPRDALPEARRRAVVPYLEVLAILADNLKITEPQPPPESWGILESQPPPTDPHFHEWAEWANERVAALGKEWETQNRLVAFKRVIPNVALLYSTQPYATDELRRLATEIVKKPEMVREIMDAVEAKIREKDEEHRAGASLGAQEHVTEEKPAPAADEPKGPPTASPKTGTEPPPPTPPAPPKE